MDIWEMYGEETRELMAARARESDKYLDGIPGELTTMPAETTIQIIVDIEIAVVHPHAVSMYQGAGRV